MADLTPPSSSDPCSLHLLLAPIGQLSGDGQLRELLRERRDHDGDDVELWYLPPALVNELGLAAGAQEREAVIAGDPAVITWLQLRFGGARSAVELRPACLRKRAAALPPEAPVPVLSA